MDIVGRIDEIGKPAWIALMVLAFIVYWPVGLALLAFIIWSGRMKGWKYARAGRWYNCGAQRSGRWSGSSGNRAFDEYRAETLRRLEEEQRDFVEFLERLRFAKDKAEFDEFLAQRRRAAGPESQPSS
jgi:hypothetical protein